MTETAAGNSGASRSWLRRRRIEIAVVIAAIEGLIVALSPDYSKWTVIIVSAPIIAFYLLAGHKLGSQTGRELSWIAAAAQSFAVLLAILVPLVKVVMLVLIAVFAAIAVVLLFGENRRKRT